jgi:isobutyryl-CoA mutase
MSEKIYIIPPDRTRYLAEIVEDNERYDAMVERQADLARRLWRVRGAIDELRSEGPTR